MRKNREWGAAVLMAVSMLSFGIPAGVFLAGAQEPMEVHAEDMDSPEGENGDGSVSDNTVPEPVCTCREKCTEEHTDLSCEVCKTDYSACAYVNPSVRITINTPSGWHNDTTKVYISVEDVAQSGNFAVQSLQAKVTQNGNWTDITEERYVEVNEDCSVYALVTDQKGRTYEKSRYIKCFDYTPPTLNAAVSDGLLSVRAQDTGSGVKVIYVNGHEFKDLVNGTLNIRLQQFDAGYQYFTISAMDHVGNMSEVYKTKNPYYSDPEVETKDQKDVLQQLPASAQATAPVTAAAQVTEHTKTDSEGNTTLETSPAEEKKAAMREADVSEAAEKGQTAAETGKGKEFYTIQTESEKIFYLVIDRDGEEETVYFLTEISENDLLNVTSDVKETLPKNSAVAESALPKTEGALPVADADAVEKETGVEEQETGTEETEEPTEETAENPAAAYILLGLVAAVVIGAAYYVKVLRKKDEGFLDEEDEEEDEEVYDDEEEELAEVDNNPEKDFFTDREDEEE